MCNAHQMVVNDVCEIIRRQTVRLQQHLIFQLLVLYRDIAEGGVMERCCTLMRDALTDDERFARLHALFCLLKRQITAGTDVFFDLACLVSSLFLV